MKKASTLFLRTVVILLGLAVLAFCAITVPMVWGDAGGYRPILIGMCVAAMPFFVALYQTMKLLTYIDQGTAFSDTSVRALSIIRRCGIVISFLYAAGMPYIYRVADMDDAPGVILVGAVIVGASAATAVFSAVLQKLLRNAIDIKKENDLVV
jgi:hypothetical protein